MTTRTMGAALLVAALALAACGKESSGAADAGAPDAGGGPKTVEEVCAAREAGLATRASECQGGPREIWAKATYVESLACPSAVKAVESGRALYDASRADACLREVATSTCAQLFDAVTPACDAVLQGQVATGAACYDSVECASQSFCSAEALTCPGTCQELVKVGFSCSGGKRCVSIASCITGTRTCVKDVGDGETCDPSDSVGPRCGPGLFCDPGTTRCVARKTTGACDKSRQECAGRYACLGGTGSIGTCTQLKLVGEGCVPNPSAGAREWQCEDLTACLGGTCAAWGGVGSPCGLVEAGEYVGCAEGWCDASPTTLEGTCVAPKGPGVGCASGDECGLGGDCRGSDGKCVAACTAP